MTKVILDTSTILDFARFSHMFIASDFPSIKIDLKENFEIMESIENTIEALILYDEVLIDEKSFFFNYKEENLILSNIAKACTFINLKEGQEEAIYKKVFEKFDGTSFLNENFSYRIYDGSFHDDPLMSDYYADKDNFFLNSYYKDYLDEFLSNIKKENIGEFYNKTRPTLKQLLYHVIRCFYYHELQYSNSSELVINPKRYELVQSIFNYKKIYTNKIIENFDNEVRKKLYTKEKKWLGVTNDSLLMPMVTSYVFNKCKSWEDLYKVIIEVKNSKDAISFRKGLSELISAIKNKDLVTINDTLSLLDDAIIKWNQSLKINPSRKYRKISVSIPMIGGIGTDIDVPYSWGDNISSKLLTFIHKMILGS